MTDDDALIYVVSCLELSRDGARLEFGTEPDTAPESPDERTNEWRRVAHDTGTGD
jgi:hypothetical protein